MLTILLLVLECLKELFLIVVVGGFTAIASAGVVIYILSKLLGVDRMLRIMELEEKVDLMLAKEYVSELDEDDCVMVEDDEEGYVIIEDDKEYIMTKDGEKIPYDEDTQE